jgi:glutathione S-transferase
VVDLFREAELFPYGNDTTSALQRARAKQFVEVFLAKVNTFYYAAVVRGEPNVGAGLVESIKKFVEPLIPDTTFIIGEKFGLAEILVSPFLIRLYLLAKLGLLGDGIDAKFAEATKWDKWARATLANESLRSTFNYEFEARKAVDRIRKIREAAKVSSNGATVANGAKA